MKLSILYRGPLSSCNYACEYCPFAKHHETSEELLVDQEALDQFVNWCGTHPENQLGVLFTPWGEALVRWWYQEALAQLTQMPHVTKAAIQTNLSCKLDWVEACDKQKLALWCTYHPGEITRKRFLAKCQELRERKVRFSVGVVGLKEHAEEIAALREELPAEVYLWINAYKREQNYYDSALLQQFTQIDSLFPINNQYHPSLGESCRAGASVISVDGQGQVRRCHFIPESLGNLYRDPLENILKERPCTNSTCGCHIGYVHLDRLNLAPVFQDGILERIPASYRS